MARSHKVLIFISLIFIVFIFIFFDSLLYGQKPYSFDFYFYIIWLEAMFIWFSIIWPKVIYFSSFILLNDLKHIFNFYILNIKCQKPYNSKSSSLAQSHKILILYDQKSYLFYSYFDIIRPEVIKFSSSYCMAGSHDLSWK